MHAKDTESRPAWRHPYSSSRRKGCFPPLVEASFPSFDLRAISGNRPSLHRGTSPSDTIRPDMALRQMMVVAGEASGDRHAASLVAELTKRLPETRFFGMGGPLLEAA